MNIYNRQIFSYPMYRNTYPKSGDKQNSNVIFGTGVIQTRLPNALRPPGLIDSQLTHSTVFLKDEINWPKLASLITQEFEDKPKAPIYCYACSDGSEPYSLAMSLLTQSGKNADKFFPIYASDLFGSTALEVAQSGFVGVNFSDIERMKKCGIKFEDYFQQVPDDEIPTKLLPLIRICNEEADYNPYYADFIAKVRPALIEKVDFKADEIVSSVEKMPKMQEPIVFMFRNASYHLDEKPTRSLVDNLSEKLAPGSLVILGSLAEDGRFSMRLQQKGFVGVPGFENKRDIPGAGNPEGLSAFSVLKKI